jgi:DNA mismatch repair protein MutS
MVEMTETAQILRQATHESLILIDEIGRGTSTYDGIALAYASCVYLAATIKAYTLFSTHYFELTNLPQEWPCIQNVHLQASLDTGRIIFLYRVEPGHANRSYGLEVAELAGIPIDVLNIAQNYLRQVQNHISFPIHQDSTPVRVKNSSSILHELAQINPDQLTAKEALDLIYHLKNLESLSTL